jgi:ABC-type uncharacterized transport system permease subunit
MNNIIIDGMSFTLPLFIMAIGGIYSERSGITNLALEGLQGMGVRFPEFRRSRSSEPFLPMSIRLNLSSSP